MLEILMIENDLEQSKDIVNCIAKSTSGIRINTIVTGGIEALGIINNQKIDFIIMSLLLTDCNALKFLEALSRKAIHKFKNSVLVISENDKLIAKAIENPCVYDYIMKPYELENVIHKIDNLAKTKEDTDKIRAIRKRIIEELQYLNYNLSYNGTKYLEDTVVELYVRNNKNNNLTKDVYTVLSKRYGKSVNTIKCNITQATRMMYEKCERDNLTGYFKYYERYRPTVKEIAFTILSKIS